MSKRHPSNRILASLTAVPTALAAVALLAGCGAGGSPEEATAKEDGASARIVQSDDPVSKSEGATEIVEAKYPTGHDTDEVSISGTKPIKPCKLVSSKQADNILGGNVKISEHLQGPTCVFSGSGREITMAVMEARLKALVEEARSSRTVRIRGKRAYCVRYEKFAVLTAIGKGRVLQVTGPCAAGVRFTAAALPRIP
jgi:hypothetical protein